MKGFVCGKPASNGSYGKDSCSLNFGGCGFWVEFSLDKEGELAELIDGKGVCRRKL